MSQSLPQLIIQRIEYFFNILTQICIGFVTIYMSWLCLRTGLAGTALHAWLATIGFSFLMAEAIMCHYNHNVLTFNYSRSTKNHLHWILQVLGGGCGIAAALIKCIQHNFQFSDTHGKLGFSAFILCCVSLVSGVATFFSKNLRKCLSPLFTKIFHNLLGIGTFAVALVAQYYGYNTGFFKHSSPSDDFTILMKVITLMILILSCWGPLKSLFHKMYCMCRRE
ncbi:transmembrane reductase CYB561D2-like [Haematobia irritans]|uniref:transmembrane reductase CYB561D2-like n=1 Tax=Haematobia irritans TaxID=7368 RepID=UPI003F4FD48F